jgi:hypothetical protein
VGSVEAYCVSIDKSVFDSVLKETLDPNKSVLKSMFESLTMIRPCSEQTRMRILNSFERREFKSGETVMEQARRSPWNLV